MTMSDELVRGVVDRIEGDLAVLVLDDGQQLNWPLAKLPADVRPGIAVVLSLAQAGETVISAQVAGGWQGEMKTVGGKRVIHLDDGQQLEWPSGVTALAQSSGQVSLQLTADAEDTEARRKRVSNLLDDIFDND
jgi:hypothetical protein